MTVHRAAPCGCPRCGYIGQDYYCPECRKVGFVVMLKDARQLRDQIETMRRDAVIIQRAIKQLEADE